MDNHCVEFRSIDKPLKEVKNNLNVFKSPWSWKSLEGICRNIEWFFRAFKKVWWRGTKGYCASDLYNCDSTILDYLVNLLCGYVNYTCSYPADFETLEDWIAYITKIIDLLDFARQDPEELAGNGDCSDLSESEVVYNYFEEVDAIKKKQEESIKEAFTLLAARFYDIWW